MNWIKNKYRTVMNTSNRVMLLLEITFKIIFIVLILPVMNLAFDYVMHLWGQSYITGANLISFISYPPTIILFVIFTFVTGLFILFKMTTMTDYCQSTASVSRPDILNILFTGFMKTKDILRSGRLIPIFYTLLLYILIKLPILIGIIIYMRLPSGYWEGSSDRFFIKGLVILVLLLIGIVSFNGIYTLHFCTSQRKDFPSGIKNSKMLLKGRAFRLASKLVLNNLMLSLVLFAAYYTVLFVSALLVCFFVKKYMVISIFLTIYPKINLYTIIIADMVVFITNLNIISTMYQSCLPKAYDVEKSIPNTDKPYYQTEPKHKNIIIVILLLVIAFGCLNFYQTIRNDTFYLKDPLTGILITSHRGNSMLAPENTLPAIEHAIEEQSDYVEIDVQQAGDGTIVLLHDRSLQRTAGLNSGLQSLTYKEIKQLDAGGWFNSAYVNTPIPTLEEALALCKGRIKVDIDVKDYVPEKNLEETIVQLINQYGMEHQCIVSSTQYNTLVKVKSLNPNIKTGLILSAAFRNIYDKEAADFYSIRSVYITKYVVNSAHRAGKEVQAWTVNRVSEIERMKALGVDCIVTDNATLTREVLYRNDATKTFIQLINRMLNNRSFYQLVEGMK